MVRLPQRLSRILLLASASLFYFPLTSRALWDSDEGRYAEIAREMLELKDWLVPHLNYVVYLEKPPLMYWLTAIAMSIFGVNAFAARFWCATFGVLTVGVAYLIGKHWKSERCGLLAGSILATSLFFFALTQFLVLDMALTFWTTLSLYAASRWIQEWAPEELRRFAILFAVAAAGGVMTKGPVALVLPVVGVALSAFWNQLGARVRRTPWAEAFGIFLVLTAPWFIAVSLKCPYFVSFFFIHEHVSRFLTTVHHRSAPIYLFVPVMVGGFLPWVFFLPRVLRTWLARGGLLLRRDGVGALLVVWTVFVFVFFSLSQSKLPAYILPIFPTMALLLAESFEEAFQDNHMPRWLEGGLVALIVTFVLGLWILKWPHGLRLLASPPASLLIAQSGMVALLLGLGVFILVGVWGMRRSDACFGGILIVSVLLWTSLSALAGAIDPYYSAERIGQWLRLNAPASQRIVTYGVSFENRLQTLVFYSRRRVAVYGDPGELTLGLSHDPEAAAWSVPEPGADAAIGRVSAGTWVVTDDEHWMRLSDLGLANEFKALMHQGRLWLLQKT